MSKKNRALLTLLSALITIGLLYVFDIPKPAFLTDLTTPETAQKTQAPRRNIILSEQRVQHILYGDDTGGGHMYGAGVPCKSEFPADWDEKRILGTVKRIAANDNLDWRQEDNGYFVTENMEDGVSVRVVLGPQKQRVITSYPTNVSRNPCPANDR